MNQTQESYPPPPQSWEIETASREQLARIQDLGVTRLVRRTWEHVPFYRERWRREGLSPNDVAGLKDLARLPVISKKDLEEDLLKNPPFGAYQGDFPSIRVQASSGSAGSPKPFFQTQRDWEIIANLWARRLYAQGVKKGDILQVTFAYSLFVVGFTSTEGAMKLGALVLPTGSGSVIPSERQVRIAKEWGTTVLLGTPSYVLYLAEVAARIGLDPRKDFKIRLSIHTSEPLTDPTRRAIEEKWGVKAYDNFGSVETGAPTFECEEREGYHINEDGYVFEVVDPESYKPVAPGQEGVIVVTSLFKEAAPVIRYNLEDISSFLEAPCPCGRTLKRLGRIKGRVSDMVKIRGVALYPTAIEGILGRFPELTGEYVLILDQVAQQDRVALRVECRPESGNGSVVKERLERELKVATGLSIEAELLEPGELARSLRIEERIKAKRIWDRRGGNHVQ